MGNKVPSRGVPKNPGRRSPLAVTPEVIEVRLGSGRSGSLSETLLTRLQPLNQEQFIEEALHLANWEGDDFHEIYDFMARLECGAANVRADRSDWTLEGVEGDVVRRRVLEMRDDWRRKLASMAHNMRQFRALAYRETFPLPQMLVRPRLIDGQLIETRYYLPDTVVAALEFVQVLLLATNLEFGDRLKRCQLEGCGRFFLQRQGWGRARSKFCNEEHGKEAHLAAARDRMRAMRERRKNSTKTRRRK
jgi:hypothetical protein